MSPRSFHLTSGLLFVSLLIAGVSTAKPSHAVLPIAPQPTPVSDEKPGFFPYRGISIGMTADAARGALGSPKEKSNEMDLYIFSESETAQVFYDAQQQVKAIAITFSGDLKSAPTAKVIFGEDVAPRPDGGIFKMVRYPKAGFWVSYNKTAGDDVVISIAIQKM
jgi:hypothetical protein